MATVYYGAGIERYLSRLPGVQAEVTTVADALAARARAQLAAHRDTGESSIEVTTERPDRVVSLVDPAALSIEYGRVESVSASGRRVGAMRGLGIISGLL